MASFRIHEDQENIHVGDIRRNVKEVFQQKRNVLGSINTNNNQFDAQTRGSKQLLKSNIPLASNENNENYQPKKYVTKQPTPAVPVAQFEAFKVYEENVENKKRNDPEKKIIDPEIKCRVNEQPLKEEIKIPPAVVVDEPPKNAATTTSPSSSNATDSPMSIDKSLLANDKSASIRTQRSDVIYDIKEYDIYRDDIYKYMRECETRHRPKPGYMRKQPDITYSMRTVLVDWLVEVAEEYKLQPETLFLAVSYIDRFLSYMSVVRAKLQLVGTAAMFIAAKYEEIYPPDVGEFVYITDDTYNKKQVLRMEHLILKVLSFDLSVPTPLTFVREFCTTNNFDEKTTSLAMYLIELCLLEADPYLQFLPSHIASGAIALARYTVDDEPWPKEFEQSTRYSLEYLRPCIAHLHTTFSNASTLEQQAVQEKYKHSKYHHVSLILPKEPTTDFIDLQLYLPATVEQQQQPSLTAQQAFEEQVQK